MIQTELDRFGRLARELADAKTRAFGLRVEIESVTDRIDDLRRAGGDREALIRAIDKRRHLRVELVEAFGAQERLVAEVAVSRAALDFAEVDE